MNDQVEEDVRWAVGRALDRAVHWSVYGAVRDTVELAAYHVVCRTAYRAVELAVYDAGRIRPSHPALQDFSTEIEAG